ncbi:hypothetical protein GH733_000331, partial [Mirounga leonina]
MRRKQDTMAKGKNKCLLGGKNWTTVGSYNIMLSSSSLKAWQWEKSQASPETLAGRYLLKDCPREVVSKVTGTELRRQDLGLYQCMIDLSPQNPHVLSKQIRLIECK